MKEDMQPWILCGDMLVRIKEEFMSEAIALLDKEIKAGNISVSGEVESAAEQDREYEKKMMVINNLMAEREKLNSIYEDYMEKEKEGNPKIVERAEVLRKFLLSVDTISILMSYVTEIDIWIKEVAKEVKAESIGEVLKSTSGSGVRIDILRRVVSKRNFVEDKVISTSECKQLKSVINNSSNV